MSGVSYVLYKFFTIHRLENPKDDSKIQFMSEVIKKHTGKNYFLSFLLKEELFLEGAVVWHVKQELCKVWLKKPIIMLVYKHISTCSYLTPVCRFDDWKIGVFEQFSWYIS